jgi:epsilon-lactone hydrolase
MKTSFKLRLAVLAIGLAVPTAAFALEAGMRDDAAKLYANGHDLRDPQLSPVYGDFTGFPPTILTSGTRDLFLSNTVRVHRKLRQAGVVADLHVFEGQSHAQYAGDPDAPETREHFGELTAFFDKYLAK